MNLSELLFELSELLSKYGFSERAEFVNSVCEIEDERSLLEVLAGLEFWGGSGAVWEIQPFSFRSADLDVSRSDYRRFQSIMVELSDMLSARGRATLSGRTADLFRRQLASS